MIIPIIAAVILALSGLYIGLSLSAGLTREADYVTGLFELTIHIEARIKYYKSPLPDIFAEYEDKRLGEGFCAALREGGLTYALEGSPLTKTLPAAELAHLREFAERLGGGTAEETVVACSYMKEVLGAYRARIMESYPKRKKMYVTLCVAGAIGAAIMVL